jgi:anthranilate phosphoribosyltransferase
MRELIQKLKSNIDLTAREVERAAHILADDQSSDEEKAGFLAALREKGETAEEIGWFAKAFLELAIKPQINFNGKPCIDICGTGRDRLNLINVSTTAMFIAAAGGAVVVKHGNRAITSRSGSADVLEKLGIPVSKFCGKDDGGD